MMEIYAVRREWQGVFSSGKKIFIGDKNALTAAKASLYCSHTAREQSRAKKGGRPGHDAGAAEKACDYLHAMQGLQLAIAA